MLAPSTAHGELAALVSSVSVTGVLAQHCIQVVAFLLALVLH